MAPSKPILQTSKRNPFFGLRAGQALTVLGVLLTLLWAAVAWDYRRSENHAVELVQRETRALALAFANHAEATFRSADRSLRILREAWIASPKQFAEKLQVHGDSSDEMTLHVAIINRDGYAIYSTLGLPDKQVYVGDHEHIQKQLNSTEDRLIISRPLQGRITKQWSVAMTRPILENGKFQGVITVSLDPTYFVKYYKDLGVGRNGAARMIRDTGEVMARSAEQEKYIGKVLNTSPYGDPDAPLIGSFRRIAQADGVERFSSYVRLPNRGVTVVVGPSVDEFMAPTREHQVTILVGASLITVILSLLTFQWVRAKSAQDQDREKIKEQQERLVMATTNNGVGVWDWDVQREDLIWDDSMFALYHIPIGEFASTETSWDTTIFAEDVDTWHRDLHAALSGTQERYESEFRIKWPTGEIRHIRSVARIFRETGGKATRLLGTNIDITERRQAEIAQQLAEATRLREMEEHRNELESRIAERTKDLSAAKEGAEAANRAKTAFLSNVSHELRTPLSQIIGLTQLIRHDHLTERQLDRLAKHDAAAKHLTDIIDAILEVTRLESGGTSAVIAPFTLGDTVAQAIDPLQKEISRKKLALTYSVENSDQRLFGDARLIKIALSNYLHNAIRFTEDGEIRVHVEIVAEEADEIIIRFEVTDTGIGIDEQEIPRLFSVFEQVDNTTTRKFGGIGLGLAITRRLAQLMGGDAGCHSRPQTGSTFWFTVSLRKA